MGNPAGVKRDFEALENDGERRFGWSRSRSDQSEAARQVKVVRQTVGRWVREYRETGKRHWQAERAGRKPRLTDDSERARGASAVGTSADGLRDTVVDLPPVSHLIDRVRDSVSHRSYLELLVSLGWSCQRPAGRALQRDEERSASGNRRPGQASKRSGKGVRSSSSTKWSSQRPPCAGPGRPAGRHRSCIQFPVEDAVGHCRTDVVDFYSSCIPRRSACQVVESEGPDPPRQPLLIVWTACLARAASVGFVEELRGRIHLDTCRLLNR